MNLEPWGGTYGPLELESADLPSAEATHAAEAELDPYVHADQDPGWSTSAAEEIARLRARVRHLRRKAKAANGALLRERRAHAEDVALIFNAALAAELEGIALPVSAMPDITGLVVEGANSMGWKGEGKAVREWIAEHA